MAASQAGAARRAASSWEVESDSASEQDSEFDAASDATQLGTEFYDMIVGMYMKGQVSAKQLCTLCWWATKAGLRGPACELGMKPVADDGLQRGEGRYQKHLDTLLGFKDSDEKLYHVGYQGHSKYDAARSRHTLPTIPPHEAIADEVSATPDLIDEHARSVATCDWPPAYTDHVVVSSTTATVLPLAVYIDGVPYSRTDSVLGFWVENMASGARHLCVLLRKRNMCKCGCKGWCTLFYIFKFLRWSFACLAEGLWPARRHDGECWHPEQDALRAAASGKALPRAAVINVKGDWAEFCHTLGFPSWNHSLRPCLKCSAAPQDLYQLEGISPVSLCFRENTFDDYLVACRRCELWVTVPTAEAHAKLVAALVYDKRKQGSGGRSLATRVTDTIPALEKDDRLEPSDAMSNVADFDAVRVFPHVALFWRGSLESVAKHRNPLFDGAIGLTTECIAVDSLHTLHLGVFQTFCKNLVWALIDANAWRIDDLATDEERIALSVFRLRTDLWAWYDSRRRERPHENITRVSDLTTKMIGTRGSPQLKLKAAETWGFLLFSDSLISKHEAALGERWRLWRDGARSLIAFYQVIKEQPRVLSPGAVQERPQPPHVDRTSTHTKRATPTLQRLHGHVRRAWSRLSS